MIGRRLLAGAIFAVALANVPAIQVHAQTATTTARPSAAGAPGAKDAWNFGDEEQEAVPTVGQVVRGQAVEISLFAVFATLALVGFFRKSETIKTVTLAASVGYLGIYRSQLVTIVNIFGLLHLNLPVFKYNVPWYIFSVFTIGSTILWGRLYCGRICAFGSMTQLMDKVLPHKLRYNLPKKIEQRAAYTKYGLLVAVCGYFLVTNDILIFRYVEPFWMFGGQGNWIMWTGLGVLLVATVFIRNLYCRFLCPVGAFLGILSNLTVFRIKRWSECNTCKICEKTCEWGAIRGPIIVKSECVRCDDCERLYLDQKKCPHWLIQIKKRSDFTARPSAAPAP